jgi:hypothetical protein
MPTVSDTFNRANEAPLAGNWTVGTGSGEAAFNLTGNVIVPFTTGSDASAWYSGATWGNDQSSKAKLTVTGTVGSGPGVGLLLRHVATASTKTYYRFVADHAASNNCAITRFLAGVSTKLLTFTQAFTDGAQWEFRAVGPAAATVLTVFLNGVQVGTITDNSSLAAGSPGIGYSSTETSASIDDWTGTDQFTVPAPLDPQIQWTDDFGPGDFGPNPFTDTSEFLTGPAVAAATDLTLTPGTPDVAWTGSTPAVTADLTLTPAAPNVAWTGSTPALLLAAVRTPGTPNVAWTGSTPAIVVDKTLTPGVGTVAWTGSTPAVSLDRVLVPGSGTVAWTGSTPSVVTDGSLTLTPGTAVVAWSGSTPAIAVDKTLTPGTPSVAWTGSTPAITADLSLAPGVGIVAWSGSTPSVVLTGAVTLTPGAATVEWSGSTPAVSVVPDVADVVLEPGGGAAAWDGLDDISTGQDRRLRPGTAVVAWSGSRATVRVTPGPLRIRLPKLLRRSEPVEAPAPPARVIDRVLAPRAGSVAWTGSGTRVTAESFVPIQDYEELKARVAELEMEREEELVVLAALSSR